MNAVVFLDLETTGLDPVEDEIWEFAAVRREPSGVERVEHRFVIHDTAKAAKQPDEFRLDHKARYDPARAVDPMYIAGLLTTLTADQPHIVGAVPSFDTERLALLLRRLGMLPGWHYHLIDVETLAVGYLAGRWSLAGEAGHRGFDPAPFRMPLPWDSDEVSRSVGVEPPPAAERHTAMGDVRWAMRVWDAVMGRMP